MSAMRVLASPKVLMPLVAVTAVLALIFFAYLYPVVSPEENLENLLVALVNEDRGAEVAGERVELGDRVVEKVTDPDSPAADTVGWARPGSREAALEGIGNGEYYGAIVIPAGYSERIADIASPPTIPIAVVNEDEGLETGGQPVNLGEQVEKRITSPDSPAPDFVEWTTLDGREPALEGIEKGEYYAAIVIPRDYSERLASMSGPPAGATAVPPTAPHVGGQLPAPEPAEMELLTSPAVRPSTTALIENAFSGIVGGISGATSERILGTLGELGVSVPPGAGAVISDPVRGEVSEAEVSGDVGPLPEAPEPAEIEVLTNPSAGPTAALPAQNISIGIVQAVSRATSERISEQAGKRGAQLPPEVAAVVGDPVRADVIEAQPVGPDSGNGQSPFFLAFLASLSGFIGTAAIFFSVDHAAERLAARGVRPSRTGLWTAKLMLGLLYAALVAAAELWVAFGLLGVEHEASTTQVYLFLAFAVAAAVAVTMLLAAVLGAAGIALGVILTVILGLVSSGGFAPLEALPPFYQAYADWLPLRYAVDGLRSLLFYDGTLDAAGLEGGLKDALPFSGEDGPSEAAGLESAIWVLGAYLAGSVTLGYAVSLVKDLFSTRRRKGGLQGSEVHGATQ
jgi:YhgE/Pip-like protein